MKILHTSDWHLGHRLHEQSQYEEQKRFLAWLQRYIDEHAIDILLVAGDIFDTSAPSAQSLKMYYDFLVELKKTSCAHIVITGGNHDAPGTLNAPKELLHAFSTHVVGKATEDIKDEVLELSVMEEKVIIAAVPYLRDQDIRRAVAGESFEQIGDRYKHALVDHYTKVSAHCQTIKKADTPIIAMGHLFAIGGSTSDSEQSIYVGNLGDIGADDFPDTFDYIALGHLHRPQKVGMQNHIRYSGTPYVLSFSEVGHDKNVLVLETKGNKIATIQEVYVPAFRAIFRVGGTLEKCVAELYEIDKQEHDLTPWVEVLLDNDSNTSIGFAEVNKVAENLKLEVLKVMLKTTRKTEGIDQLMANTKDIKALSPIEIFKLKCKEQDYDLDAHEEIVDAFNEVLQIVQKA